MKFGNEIDFEKLFQPFNLTLLRGLRTASFSWSGQKETILWNISENNNDGFAEDVVIFMESVEKGIEMYCDQLKIVIFLLSLALDGWKSFIRFLVITII